MKISIVHGYFLNGTGSNLYVQNLCRQFCIMGHDVLLFCQERSLEKYDFIETGYLLDKSNEELGLIHTKSTPYPGKCKCCIPNIGGILPVYVHDVYEGFDVQEITQISEKDLEAYVNRNAKALNTCFLRSKPDFVICNHTVMQPVYVKRGLQGIEGVVNFTVVHGSCLNFSVRKSDLALKYAIEGLEASDILVFLTAYSLEEFTDFFAEKADFKGKKVLIHAGVDIEAFVPLEKTMSKRDRIERLVQNAGGGCGDLLNVDWEQEKIVLYYGKYLWTKGIHNLILAFPFVLQENPNTRLILVGFGTSRDYLEQLVQALDLGDSAKLKILLTNPQDFQGHVEPGTAQYSNTILDLLEDPEQTKAYFEKTVGIISQRIIFTGFMDHSLLKDIIPCADITVAPSIFPEAFGLVAVEALACGIFPVQTYHSGFKHVVDSYAQLFELDEKLKQLDSLLLNKDLVKNLSTEINTILECYNRQGSDLVEKVRTSARRISTENYSWDSVAEKFLSEASAFLNCSCFSTKA